MPRIPFDHQIKAAAYAVENKGACYWMKMRTGKTFSTVMALRDSLAFPALIVCPKSIMPVWREEFLIEGADPEMITFVDGPPQTRERILANHSKNPKAVVIVNYEMIEPYRVFTRYPWASIVLDESLKIGNLTSKRTQYCLDYIQSKRYPADQMRFCLSGSPASESPFQLIPQMFFVHGNFMGEADWQEYVRKNWDYNAYSYKWEPLMGKKHIKEIQAWNEKAAFHCDLGIGDSILRRRITIEPSPIQVKLLDRIREERSYVDKDGIAKDFTPLVRADFELQVCAGLDPFTKKMVDTRKIEHILDWHMDNDCEPVLIITRYRTGIMKAFEEVASKYGKKMKFGIMAGGEDNSRVKESFDHGVINVVLGQITVVKMGLNFSRANTIFYLSNSFSQDDRTQSELRCSNMSKENPVEVIDLLLKDCLDGSTVDLLEKKQDVSSQFVQKWYEGRK